MWAVTEVRFQGWGGSPGVEGAALPGRSRGTTSPLQAGRGH